MIETIPIQKQLQGLIAALDKQISIEQTLNILEQSTIVLKLTNLDNVINVKQFIAKYLKTLAREVTNFAIGRVPQSKLKLQSLLMVIIQLYAKAARLFLEISAFQNLDELLSRTTQLFQTPKSPIEQSEQTVQLKFQSKWVAYKNKEPYSTFYYKCLNTVLDILQGIQSTFIISGLSFIKQYMCFLSKIANFLKTSKFLTLIERIIQSLQILITSVATSKQVAKQLSSENLRNICAVGIKLSEKAGYSDWKKRFQMLPSLYGLSLLGSNSIQKKLNGVKIINKESEEFYKCNNPYVGAQQYILWLLDNKVFDMVMNESPESSLVLKNCNYIFRILFRKRCLNEKNFNKILDFIEQINSENRQLILKYLQYETIRMEYDEYRIYLARLKKNHKPDFWEEDHFVIAGQFIRYSTTTLILQFKVALSNILNENYGKFKNQKIELRCIKSLVRSIVCLIDRQMFYEMKINYFLEMYDSYFDKAITHLGIVIFRGIFEELPETAEISKSKCANFLINRRNAIGKNLQFLNNNNNNITLQFKNEIEDFLILILKYAEDCYGQKQINIQNQVLLNSLQSPSLFTKLVTFINKNQIEQMYEQLINKFNVQNFSFDIIKHTFYRMNNKNIKQVKNYSGEYLYEVKCKVDDLLGVQNLKYLALNAANVQSTDKVCDFLSDLYTNFVEERATIGQQQLLQKMIQTLKLSLIQFGKKQSETKIIGYLSLIQYFMMATQILGVGNLKPHNSLVPISTVHIRIDNDMTYGNDVSQTFDKKVLSNLTLFELLTQVSEKFRCSTCQISLHEGNFGWPQKWNGLTLQQLKMDGKILRASKSLKDKIRLQNLLQNGELTNKAKKAFQQIYNSFATQGKMGKIECSNFVAGVTKTSSSPYDNRVIEFLKDYDSDHDDNISLEDFFNFYKANITQGRQDVVWKNLQNMRFRKDLKKYDDPVEISNQNIRFRNILHKSQQFYHVLFRLSQSSYKQLESRSKRLLLRLPTFQKTLQSIHSQLDLISKNSFQTQYLLIAIQSKLNKGDDQNEQKKENQRLFIESGNSLQIFQMMIRIDKIQNVRQDEKKCLYISLQIMRSLFRIVDLRTDIKADYKIEINLKLPQTKLFKKLACSAYKNIEIQILQAALILQQTQQQSLLQLALKGIFHHQSGIRKICCNYILILYLQKKISKDLFEIQVQQNCEFWFETLTKICLIDKNINADDIIKRGINILKIRKQTVQKNSDDPIIYGYLNIIYILIKQNHDKCQNISAQIIEILSNVLSNKSRHIIFLILAYFDINFAISFAIQLIKSVKHVKQIQAKNCYVGLKNLSNTCYLNSVLQALFCVQQFKNFILSLPQEDLMVTQVSGKNILDSTLFQLQKMYTYFLKSSKKYYNPEEFCLTIKDNGTGLPIDIKIQEDAHEFVGKFLDKLQKYAQKLNVFQQFQKLFEGQTITKINCAVCQNKILRQEPFLQLSLAVQKLHKLEQSFQKYISAEQIQDYFCQKCSRRVQKIEKSTLLSKLPKVLIINLQRIIFDLEDCIFKKIDSTFEFPHQLNVFQYMEKQSNARKEDCEYRLKGIIIHSGNSESGHYYSILKIGDGWFKFNDQQVAKFDVKQLPHQAFGGLQSKEQWGDELKFSTNAYILIYEKKQQSQSHINENLNQNFCSEISQDNEKFYRELQVHQQSLFLFADELFEKFQPTDLQEKMKIKSHDQDWNTSTHLQQLQAIFQFHLQLLKFATTFYTLRQNLIFKIGQNIFRLFYLLPQKSYSFLTSLNPDQCIQNMCIHNDDNIRSINKFLLNKAIHVFNSYYIINFESQQPGVVHLIKILDCLFAFLEDERLNKNISKSYHFFDFWKVTCQFVSPVLDYCVRNQMIAIIADMLMGNDSPFADKNKKRPQSSLANSLILVQILMYLMSRKKNLKGYINPMRVFEGTSYYEMTQKQKTLLGSMNFYGKLIRNKWQNGIMAVITSRLCQQDQEFSVQMAIFILQGLNNIIDPESSIILLSHLRGFLLVQDGLVQKRLKWVLGVPQLRMGDELVYGMAYEDDSVVYEFTSPLDFISKGKQNLKPALAVLYDNQSIYNKFTSLGIQLLFDLICQSETTFHYILSLPPPTYLQTSHLDWIYKYINNLKDNAYDDIKVDKQAFYNKYIEVYQFIVQKIKMENFDLPINKNIIGRNKELVAIQTIYHEQYSVTLWCHCTYLLPNSPNGVSNLSLPNQLFKYANAEGWAKYFISVSRTQQQLPPSSQLASQFSVCTLEITAKEKLKINLKFTNYHEEVYVNKGKTFINFPYEIITQDLQSYLQVKVLAQTKSAMQQQKKLQQHAMVQQQPYMSFEKEHNLHGIQCRTCTLINDFEAKNCEACDTPLY